MHVVIPHSLVEEVVGKLRKLGQAALAREQSLIGHEGELVGMLGIGRSTFRAAVRLLEAQNLLIMRTGRGGGLFLAASFSEPHFKAVASHVRNLELPLRLFYDVYLMVHGAICHMANRNCPANERAALGWMYLRDQPQQFSYIEYTRFRHEMHHALARQAGNPLLALFYRILKDVYRDTMDEELHLGVREASNIRRIRAAEVVFFDAFVSHPQRVNRALRIAIASERQIFRETIADKNLPERITPTTFFSQIRHRNGSKKLASQTARAILGDVRERHLPRDALIGTIRELSERIGVSTDIVREAVLLLEQDGMAKLRRGRKGGVYLARPPADGLRRKIRAAVSGIRFSAEHIREMQSVALRVQHIIESKNRQFAECDTRKVACIMALYLEVATTVHATQVHPGHDRSPIICAKVANVDHSTRHKLPLRPMGADIEDRRYCQSKCIW